MNGQKTAWLPKTYMADKDTEHGSSLKHTVYPHVVQTMTMTMV